ncbi:MAG: cytochrome C [Erythrobacter sp.]|nr:cytochrome C [Erythrobacter sp.]
MQATLSPNLRVKCIIVSAAAALAGSVALATPAKQVPWLPEAAAYRLTLHYGNLAPVPWEAIAEAWSEPYRGAEFPDGAFDRIAENSALSTEAVAAAIAAEDRHALFGAATRLLASRIGEELDRAIAASSPSAAQAAVSEAQELYRAFGDHVQAADPEAARELGLAWLELTSAAGSSGVLGAGAVALDDARMKAAGKVIRDYLAANYLTSEFDRRAKLSAVPETVAAGGTATDIPATLPPGSDIFDQDPLPRLVLNFEEQGIDEKDLPMVAYGDMLFDSPEIFGEPARSVGIACSSCHNRSDINQRFFIPGVSHQPGAVDVDGAFFNPMFNDRRADSLDIPSLRGLRFTGPYGRDGRFASLREFSRNVIVNEFGGAEPTPFMLDALVAYLFEFDFLPNAMVTPEGALTEVASDAAHRGEAIFNRPMAGLDDKSCASCHIPSANFLDGRAHDIGSAEPGYDGARAGAFDTPTLLGTAYTAPYFHDGALPTLASVVDWFDETKSLELSDQERSDLTAYLEAVGAADDPYEGFGERNTPFRLAFEELTTFASTLDTLLPARDRQHTLLLTDTVAADLAADAGTMSNQSARPEIYSLARLLVDVGEAVRADDWTAAEAHWTTFKAEAEKIEERVY